MTPFNFVRLNDVCSSEETALRFLQEHNIVQKERKCCENYNMKLSVGVKITWRCPKCKKHKGIRSDNWLECTRLPFLKIVRFIYWWSRELTSVKFCQFELEIDDNTVVDWNNYLREVCAYVVMDCCVSKIGGEGLTVEIGECVFSPRKHYIGHVVPQQWVFGGRCHETKEVFIVMIPDRSPEALCGVIREKVSEGSIIISDCWKGYMNSHDDDSFQQFTAKNKYYFVESNSGARNPKVRKVENGTDMLMPESYYLIEFLWRVHIKKLQKDSFQAILEAIAQFMPPR